MEPHPDPSQQPRGFRKRMYQWAGQKVNQLLDTDTGLESSSPAVHQTGAAPTRHHNDEEGQNLKLPQEPDHYRLRFKVRGLILFSCRG
jgi:hypothetical protein